jgi:hypothetical protein
MRNSFLNSRCHTQILRLGREGAVGAPLRLLSLRSLRLASHLQSLSCRSKAAWA